MLLVWGFLTTDPNSENTSYKKAVTFLNFDHLITSEGVLLTFGLVSGEHSYKIMIMYLNKMILIIVCSRRL